jgi:membrane protein implicated in regulation of membrane protease activity
MSPFWSNIYDDAKDRRYGALFFSTLLMLFGSLGVIAVICAITNAGSSEVLFPLALAVTVIFTLALAWRAWAWLRGWNRPEAQLKSPVLSRDELVKARSKLKKETKAAALRTQRRPARLAITRVPDTNLKY